MSDSPASERAVLGALMIDGEAWRDVAGIVEPDDFAPLRHRLIFGAMATLAAQGMSPDASAVTDTLGRRGELNKAGGADYLAELVEQTPSAANVRTCARQVAEAGAERRCAAALKAGDRKEARRQLARLDASDATAPRIQLRQAAEIATDFSRADWLLWPYLERRVIALMFGGLGSLKSFTALDMSLAIAAGMPWGGSTSRNDPAPAVYLSAEGKGLRKRLNAWALYHGVDLKSIAFYGIERQVDLSTPEAIDALAAEINALDIAPAIIVLDTLSKIRGRLDEDSNTDMGYLLAMLRTKLVERFGSTVLLVHHVGHMEKQRGRGAYALAADTEANYLIERPDPDPKKLVLKMTTGRLKDDESPPPLYLEGRVMDLGTYDDRGNPETSLVMLPTDERPAEPRKQPSGKRRLELLRLLESEHRSGRAVWTIAEVRRLARDELGMSKTTAHDAADGLLVSGFLQQTIGGLTLADPPGSERSETVRSARNGPVRRSEKSEGPIRPRTFGPDPTDGDGRTRSDSGHSLGSAETLP